jgi:ankyrin repeat protein
MQCSNGSKCEDGERGKCLDRFWAPRRVHTEGTNSDSRRSAHARMPDYDAEDVWFNSLHNDVEEVKRSLAAAPAGSVNHIGVRGWTPLYAACAKGHAQVVDILLQASADTELPTTSEWRPLMTAAQQGFVEITQALLSHGADPSAKNKDGHTALDLARKAGKSKVCDLLDGARHARATRARAHERERTTWRRPCALAARCWRAVALHRCMLPCARACFSIASLPWRLP